MRRRKRQDALELACTQAYKIEGDLCGAVFIDDEFERCLCTEVGRRQWESLDRDLRRRVMTTQWEHTIKRQFDSTRISQIWPIDIAGVGPFKFTRYERQQFDDQKLTLPGAKSRPFFSRRVRKQGL
jgi:hypothetical protein